MTELHLDLTLDKLNGPPKEHIKVHNYWAAVGLDRYHKDSKAEFEFTIDGKSIKNIVTWDSKFSKVTMKEDKDIANHGGVALAWFVMSVIMDYKYVEQTEIGDGVDYRFSKNEPDDDDLNFLDEEYHYVEISGILEENKSNTLVNRIKKKHEQINRGSKKDQASSVVVTLFAKPTTVKEIHK
ncbi:hypothetical protein OWR28_06105 [Chryseobacterium sp. 1B4]